MLRKLSDNSLLWLVPLLIAFLLIFYFLDPDGRDKLLQVITVIFGMTSIHLFLKVTSDRIRSRFVSKEQIQQRKMFIVRKSYVYMSVMISIVLFFAVMNYLAQIFLLGIVIVDVIVTSAKLLKFSNQR